MAEYDLVQKGSLKLKGVQDSGISKKKKKRKDSEKLAEQFQSTIESEAKSDKRFENDKRTKAEKSYEKYQQRKMEKQLLEKAAKSHKERILDFNKHLDNLTEHFDIPKVSWTK